MKRATAAAVESSAAIQNENGEWVIPGTRRPDGTFRKERVVKDGYVPQEETKIFETKGNSSKPVGIPGLAPQVAAVKEIKPSRRSGKKTSLSADTSTTNQDLDKVITATADLLIVDADPAVIIEKKLKNLRKKLREINSLEESLASLKTAPTADQLNKLNKKSDVEKEIADLETACIDTDGKI
mmetsp:Transcript_19391/g.18736  ORF Transcript_19391/g.18736 Transcript_19391/m.18736 type:complete len:183 (-) Transcript_19391:337-885(-)|eukprot:CAMPEP_0119045826 /NCGR_PEP_ID=MMETSP1177-20130426/42777_1 /TAXON_ID=2985 /ORGANISM="Ochromonas sp, Strain CCMP1899" /LENGTH=182 /DNA_ID=CAMNT_0007018201 /DNA_START=67 /DNA_END=615 /DNA_ORIENTATION=+